MPPMPPPGWPPPAAGFSFSGSSVMTASVVRSRPEMDAAFAARYGYFGRINDASFHEVHVFASGDVVASLPLRLLTSCTMSAPS